MTLPRLSRASAPKTGGWFNALNITIMLLIVIATLYPFLNVLAISLNDSQDTVRGGITILPRVPTWNNFKEIFNYGGIPQAFVTSVLRTVILDHHHVRFWRHYSNVPFNARFEFVQLLFGVHHSCHGAGF
jgi:ABC-type maltose transport system permease subunit